MNCPTCALELAERVEFCPRCGWAAGHLDVLVPGGQLAAPAEGEATGELTVRNTGAGPVEYSLRLGEGQPWAALVEPGGERVSQVERRRLGPGQEDSRLRLAVRVADLPATTQAVEIQGASNDRGGASPRDRRPWNAGAHRDRTWRVTVPIQRLGAPHLRLGAELVVFTAARREARLAVENTGGGPTSISLLEAPPGISVAWEAAPAPAPAAGVLEVSFAGPGTAAAAPGAPEAPQSPPGPRALEGGQRATLLLRAACDFVGPAPLVLGEPGGQQHAVTVYAEVTQAVAGLVRRWTIGIDFGTAKSAVYYTDNWVNTEERQPQPLLWPAGPSARERTAPTTRSAVMYQAGNPAPLCGHLVPVAPGAEAEGELVIQSLKSQLRGGPDAPPIQIPGGREVSPEELVAQFLQYLHDQIRGAEPFREHVDLDARFVMTLPVMEDRAVFLRQRDSTLRAAERASLPVKDMLTPSEPECAALDLMHSLRRGDYTFNGKVYQLQDGEVILVFDCGAGTTDLAVLRVALTDGRFGAEQLCGLGYRFGGDTVDDLLLSSLLEERAERTRFGRKGTRAMLRVEGEGTGEGTGAGAGRPMPLQAAREECRRVKESLFAEGSGEEPREFRTDLGVFTLTRGHVERLVAPFVQSMLTAGVMPDPRILFPGLDQRLDDDLRGALWREMLATAGSPVRTLEQALGEAHLQRSDVTFLFVTGGTGQVPVIPRLLYQALGRTSRVVVAMPQECTVNVARGASLYYDYQVSGILKCAVDLVGRDPATGAELFREAVCAPGALPGPELERAVRVGPGQAVELGLAATYPTGGPAGLLGSELVRNLTAQPRQVVVTTRYGGDRALSWSLRYADGEALRPEEAVLRL